MENTEEKSPSQILNEAADLLEEEGRWGQRKYFSFKGQTDDNQPACVMCAHGAIAYCGRQEVREKVLYAVHDDLARLTTLGVIAPCEIASPASAIDAAARENLTVEQYIHKYYKGNTGIAHHRAIQAGLTVAFNDAPGRTKQQVIAKLREAATIQ